MFSNLVTSDIQSVLSRTLRVRLFQFAHIKEVPVLCTYYICSIFWNINGKKKVKESRYRPGVAQRVPGS
jgi:hypothetical protein